MRTIRNWLSAIFDWTDYLLTLARLSVLDSKKEGSKEDPEVGCSAPSSPRLRSVKLIVPGACGAQEQGSAIGSGRRRAP
jgi:hypothetical protein